MRIHKDLTLERWNSYSLAFRMANIGADASRCMRYKKKGELIDAKIALERMLELIDATVADPYLKRSSRREILRTREAFIDFILFDNEYQSTDTQWENYFNYFSFVAAAERNKN